jgi:hypothetical protein
MISLSDSVLPELAFVPVAVAEALVEVEVGEAA